MPALNGKVILVTGAAKGVGRAYALDAAREGALVVVNDIDADVVRLAEEIVDGGGQAVANQDTVTSWEGAAAIVGCAIEAYGRLDGLVNNAGILHVGQPWEFAEHQVRESLDVNVLGSIFVGTHAMKPMIAQGSGSIVNNSSTGHLGAAGRAVYVAAKGALASLTYAWAVDLAPHGIRVNAFAASAKTAMSKQNPTPVSGLPMPEANAPLVSYLLSDASEGITGQIIYKYQDGFMVLSHPDFTEHHTPVHDNSVAGVVKAFDPVLRAGAQRVGWHGPGGRDYQR